MPWPPSGGWGFLYKQLKAGERVWVRVAWIKFEKDLLTDPRVLKMAKALDARHKMISNLEVIFNEDPKDILGNAAPLPAVTLVCGCLVRLWSLADTHVDENDVLPLGRDDIDKLLGVPEFCALMPREWMEYIDKDSVRLPNFHGHNGTEAKRKAVTQKRVAAFRARNASALPDQTKTRPIPNSSSKRLNGAHKVDESPVVETLPLRGGGQFDVRQSLVSELEPVYTAVDIPTTLKEMKGWLLLNTDRQKTRQGIRRFIGNWLQSEQQKHGR